ncbi:MAG: FHA domain-containing protein [Caldilineales bacterium]|nr:FHA domain-containing protein [Caldilineales bacterium]MCW5858320.1 FHA domain-containing protein [Caldilineales bacterium]
MSEYDRTQAVGGGAYPVDSPTEVVGSPRTGGGQPYRSESFRGGDQTIRMDIKRQPPSFAFLVITKGRRLGDILRLNLGETSIGRETDNDVIVDDDYCSRYHAKVKVEDDAEADNQKAFFIYDLATPNHTYVNDEETLRAKLVDGARVQIGETIMVFKKV